MNQELMGTRDSFVLNRRRVGKITEKGKGTGTGGEVRLEKTVDVSPGEGSFVLPSRAGGKVKGKGKGKGRDVEADLGTGKGKLEQKVEAEKKLKRGEEQDQGGKDGAPLITEDEESHPDEHVDCPIYEIERPRWHEAKFGGRRLVT